MKYYLLPWEEAFKVTSEKNPAFTISYDGHNEICRINKEAWDYLRTQVISNIRTGRNDWDSAPVLVDFEAGGSVYIPRCCIRKVSDSDNLSLKDFVAHYVAHNSVVTLYEEKRFESLGIGSFREYKKIWSGMDWQIACGPGDERYFEAHPDVEKCPFVDRKVIKLLGGFEDEINTVDSINLCVEDN